MPAAVLEDGDELLVWAREAIEAAGRSAAAKTRKPATKASTRPVKTPVRRPVKKGAAR